MSEIDARTDLAGRYLQLLKRSLVNDLYIENEARIVHMLLASVNGRGLDLATVHNIRDRDAAVFSEVDRAKEIGDTVMLQDGPTPLPHFRMVTDVAHTMIGRRRLDNLEHCLKRILADRIPGDLIETGVWRGGAVIFMRGFLAAHDVRDRIVWAADSFAGLPKPSIPQDVEFDLSAEIAPNLVVGLDAVRELFDRYGLLDEQVRFLKGWFRDTLSAAPIERLALLRLDGDLYESTMDALSALYDKVSGGGFIIVDDYHSCPPCRAAVDDFRRHRNLSDEMIEIDPHSVFWRRRA